MKYAGLMSCYSNLFRFFFFFFFFFFFERERVCSLHVLKKAVFCLSQEAQEARRRQSQGLDPLHFPEAISLSETPVTRDFLPGEKQIRVVNLLQTSDQPGLYRSESGPRMWLTFAFLMGA